MKLLFTILFFTGLLLLVALTFEFLKLLDAGTEAMAITGTLLAMAFCILLLVYFLARYIKLPPSDNQ